MPRGQSPDVDAAAGAKSVVLVAARAGGEVDGVVAHALAYVGVPEPALPEARRPLDVIGARAPTLRPHERLPRPAFGGTDSAAAAARGVLLHLGHCAGGRRRPGRAGTLDHHHGDFSKAFREGDATVVPGEQNIPALIFTPTQKKIENFADVINVSPLGPLQVCHCM